MSTLSPRRLIAAGLYFATALVFAGEALTNRVIDLGGKGAVLVPKLAGLAPELRTESTWDLVYTVLIVLSMVALVPIIQGRGATLVLAGAALTLVGNLAHSAVVVIQVLAANMPAGDPAAMARLWDGVNNDTTLLPIMLMIIVFPLGGIVVAGGLVRAGIVGWWVLAAWIGLTALDLVLRFPGSHSLLAVVFAAVAAYTSAQLLSPANSRVAAAPAAAGA